MVHPSVLAPVLHLFLSFSPVTHLAFATHNLSVLRRLHLSEPTIFDNERVQEILIDTVVRNPKLDTVVLDVKFISVALISQLAWHCPNLKVVKLDSMNIFYWDESGERRRVWPCTCWGAIPGERLKTTPNLEYESIDLTENPDEEMLERKLLCCLRKLCKCCGFRDLNPLNPSPLALHEYKCRLGALNKDNICNFENINFRRGLFYDGAASDEEEEDLVGDINLMNEMQEELWWSSSSSSSTTSESSPSSSPQPKDIEEEGHSNS